MPAILIRMSERFDESPIAVHRSTMVLVGDAETVRRAAEEWTAHNRFTRDVTVQIIELPSNYPLPRNGSEFADEWEYPLALR